MALSFVFGLTAAFLATRWRKLIYMDYRRRLGVLRGDDAEIPRPSHILAVEPEMAPDLLEKCAQMATRLGIQTESLRFYCDAEDDCIGAYMVESKGLVHILFSSGFFKLWQERPNAAEAIIAHELGHAVQRDTAAWIYVDSFVRFYPKRAMTLALIQSGVLLLAARFTNWDDTTFNGAVAMFFNLPVVFFSVVVKCGEI